MGMPEVRANEVGIYCFVDKSHAVSYLILRSRIQWRRLHSDRNLQQSNKLWS